MRSMILRISLSTRFDQWCCQCFAQSFSTNSYLRSRPYTSIRRSGDDDFFVMRSVTRGSIRRSSNSSKRLERTRTSTPCLQAADEHRLYETGGKSDYSSGLINFMSTLHIIATSDQIVNGMVHASALAGAIGSHQFPAKPAKHIHDCC